LRERKGIEEMSTEIKGAWRYESNGDDHVLELEFDDIYWNWMVKIDGETVDKWNSYDKSWKGVERCFDANGKPASLRLFLFGKFKLPRWYFTLVIWAGTFINSSWNHHLLYLFEDRILRTRWKLYIEGKEVEQPPVDHVITQLEN